LLAASNHIHEWKFLNSDVEQTAHFFLGDRKMQMKNKVRPRKVGETDYAHGQ
jgi:hypothetical protein